jgi:hypothetical protein
MFLQLGPTFVLLAQNVGPRSLALGLKRVKRLLKPFFRGFAAINRTLNDLLSHHGGANLALGS